MSEITLESPFPLYAVPRVWLWIQQAMAGKLDDFAPRDAGEFVTNWSAQERAGRRSWAVIRDGEIGGVIASSKITPAVADLHLVFKREFWGHKTTVPALWMTCAEIFGNGYPQGVEKIETKILPENRPALAMAGAVGFTREGLLRGHTLLRGKLIDVVIVGLGRGKFNELRDKSQQHGHEQPVPAERPENAIARAGGDPAVDLLHAPELHAQPAGRGQSGAHGGQESGQQQLQRVG